jgi:signal transduction histidine kinase/streptogramin lyase
LKDERVTAFSNTNDFAQGLILALCEGHDGSLWIGADYDGGLTRMKNAKFKHYTSKDGLPKAPLKVIREDSKGRLWIGTSRGLGCFKGGKFTNYTTKNRLANDVVHAICEDHQGNLWFGTDDGLSKWADGSFTNFTSSDGLSDNTINSLYEDGEGEVWIGTARGGLNRRKAGVFKAYTTSDGLFSDEIFEVIEDDLGWLWMTCSKGIFRVRKSDFEAFDQRKIRALTSIEYGKADGIESPQCSSAAKPGAWKGQDGRLWFPTSKGVIVVDPKTIKIDHLPPPVYVEQVVADRRPLLGADALNHNQIGTGANSVTDDPDYFRIRVPPGRGELEFAFTALNFRAPERCHLKYKLEGVDQDWIDAGTRRTAHYNNIYPGAYRFRVIASNKDGVWNEAGTSLDVVLLPHVWQTWWFEGLVALSVLGFAGGTGRYVTKRRMRRRLELLEQRQAVEKERRRIAKDMHDQLGAGLTQVGLLGELARRDADKPERARTHASRICELAREQAQTLEEIVWTVEPKNDLLNKLAAYMAVYAEQFFKAADIRCRLDIPPGLPPQPLSAELRHNLFLAVKEALNNIAKHAGASEVHIRFALNDSKLEIGIEDNGTGFALQEMNGFGNGLSNMKHRIEEIGGHFSLSSEPAKGTRLRFEVPLRNNGAENGN